MEAPDTQTAWRNRLDLKPSRHEQRRYGAARSIWTIFAVATGAEGGRGVRNSGRPDIRDDDKWRKQSGAVCEAGG